MNKYISILIIVAAVIVGGVLYRFLGASEDARFEASGVVREFTVRAIKNEWRFEPDVFDVGRGDRVKITVVNEDDYDHGFSIDAYGISQRVPAGGTITVSFVATKVGDFPFYCSVPCGDGEVEGVKRGHFDQVGKVLVR